MAQAKFRIGITRDNLKPNGKPIFDESAFQGPRTMRGSNTNSFLRTSRNSRPRRLQSTTRWRSCWPRSPARPSPAPNRRLKLIARFGVGYDTVDVPACTENGVILSITPDGVRRPLATVRAHADSDAGAEGPDQGQA